MFSPIVFNSKGMALQGQVRIKGGGEYGIVECEYEFSDFVYSPMTIDGDTRQSNLKMLIALGSKITSTTMTAS